MRWSERQRAMLAEMGLRPWFRDDGGVVTEEELPVEDAPPTSEIATPPVDLPASAPAAAVSTEAAWLIVDGPIESADANARAAAEAEQQMLLVNMLRAVGVSPLAGAAAARSAQVRTGTPDMADPERLLAQVRPRCVLVLGRAPAMALLDIDEPLGRLRGRVHAWHGVPVVVTFSLAYLLRHPGEKAKAWLDLCLAASAFAPPAPS